MARFTRTTLVEAPLAEVWEFHQDVNGLFALTPGWFGVSVESIEPRDRPLGAGTEIVFSTAPFGVLPGSTWRSRIVDRDRGNEHAMFRDETETAVVDRWIHTHDFFAVDRGTVIHDEVEYELRGPIPDVVMALPLAALFRYRHRRLHRLFD